MVRSIALMQLVMLLPLIGCEYDGSGLAPLAPDGAVPVDVDAAPDAAPAVDPPEPVPPTGVRFGRDVAPIFKRRECIQCHSDRDGRHVEEAGDLDLDQDPLKIYNELFDEATAAPLLRVDVAVARASLVLTMPSAETPPDAHPIVVFTGADDPDFLTILGWILEGAPKN